MHTNKIFIFPLAAALHLGSAIASSGVPVSETAGSLPYSTQWKTEQTESFLYVDANYGQMNSQAMVINQYVADFGTQGFAYPSIDFFSRLASFADPESPSFLRDFSVWGRYGLGAALRSAQLSSTLTPIDGSVAHDSMLIMSARLGAVVGFDRWSGFRPFAGIELDPYVYRNTAGISGAEQQGGALACGAVIGAHFPLFFGGRGSLMAEYQRVLPIQTDGQIIDGSDHFTAGAGLAF